MPSAQPNASFIKVILVSIHESVGKYLGLIILALLCVFLFLGCGDDKGTDPVFFSPPGEYNGTYRVVFDWLTSDSTWAQCNVHFNFRADDSVFMWTSDNGSAGDFHICSVSGVYQFTGDSLILDISNTNLENDLCNPTASPGGSYRHTVDGDYLVFEIRDWDPYRKIELLGR